MKRKKNIISKSETENERKIESSFYRLIFMGDSEVGKTQIINKYTNKIYKEEYVAVKCMKKKYTNIETINSLREIRALKRLSSHKNIISLLEVIL